MIQKCTFLSHVLGQKHPKTWKWQWCADRQHHHKLTDLFCRTLWRSHAFWVQTCSRAVLGCTLPLAIGQTSDGKRSCRSFHSTHRVVPLHGLHLPVGATRALMQTSLCLTAMMDGIVLIRKILQKLEWPKWSNCCKPWLKPIPCCTTWGAQHFTEGKIICAFLIIALALSEVVLHRVQSLSAVLIQVLRNQHLLPICMQLS